MRRLLTLLLVVMPIAAFADNWTRYPDSGCIGGSQCGGRHARIRITLEPRPVVGVRFFARDNVGKRSGGMLRVRVGEETVRDNIDIKREGSVISIDVDAVRGNVLTIEPAADDEVQVERIEVLYGAARDRGTGGNTWGQLRRGGGRSGWREYRDDGRCIGGRECRQNGSRITIVLDDLPVLGVRFFAHDDIGSKADGHLNVRIDDKSIASYIDIERRGKLHELDVNNVRGTKLVIETANDDEVDIKDIAVLYGRDDRDSSSWDRGGRNRDRDNDEKGGCIGGAECGGSRAALRIRLEDRPVESITFYAHDDVGARAGGRLRIRIDDDVIESDLDIKREGKQHTIDGRKLEGRWLVFEPATDDEVVIENIRVRYAY